MIVSSLEYLNYSGPLRKNQNSNLDEHPNLKFNEIDINHIKHQIHSLYERLCRLALPKGTESKNSETISENKTTNETIIEGDENSQTSTVEDSSTAQNVETERDEEDVEESDWLNGEILTTDMLNLDMV